mmetsp:Transcript_8089/g.25390  ORF Transcript_8089/g.25390 Transcript_8089/m.25390 type:complete len:202 (+) Transcript_8089:367-972(+)
MLFVGAAASAAMHPEHRFTAQLSPPLRHGCVRRASTAAYLPPGATSTRITCVGGTYSSSFTLSPRYWVSSALSSMFCWCRLETSSIISPRDLRSATYLSIPFSRARHARTVGGGTTFARSSQCFSCSLRSRSRRANAASCASSDRRNEDRAVPSSCLWRSLSSTYSLSTCTTADGATLRLRSTSAATSSPGSASSRASSKK